MAKKKSETPVEEAKAVPTPEAIEAPVQEETVPAAAEEPQEVEPAEESEKAAEETPSQPEKEAEEPEITEDVAKILKMYPDCEAVFIDPKGGVFPVNSMFKPADAVLYKNPYFNK